MKIKFDASQQYQLDAIQAVVDLFNGQPMAGRDFEINSTIGPLNLTQSALGFGNGLLLSDDKLLSNLQAVQQRFSLDTSSLMLCDKLEFDAQKLEYRLSKVTDHRV